MIDTNVLLVANGQHVDVSPECVEECIHRLKAIEKSGVIVIDDGYRILGEYLHKNRINRPKVLAMSFEMVAAPCEATPARESGAADRDG